MRAFLTVVALLPLVLAAPVFATARDEASDSRPSDIILPSNGPVWQGPLGSVLYDNGPLVNSPGTGFGGADESVLQSVSLSMNTIGFGHQALPSIDNRIADDFVVPAGQTWDISNITFFAYQTGSPTTSTMTAVHFEIWDGIPAAVGSTLLFGDMSTNRLIATSWSTIYRVTETSGGATSRPIMAQLTSPLAPLQLGVGQYWIAWQTDGTLSSGPWAPPITINGQATTGDGLQSISGGAYAAVIDSGSGTGQGFPFIIEGSTGPISIDPSTWASVKVLYR